MNLHFAAVYGVGQLSLHGRNWEKMTSAEQSVRSAVTHILESYHYFNKASMANQVRMSSEKVFLDSGAFSAHMLGAKIDIVDYCKFCQKHSDVISFCSVLDAIGDAEQTWKNQLEMERMGVQALPCFHLGEPVEYLERYLSKYEYITLGGLARVGIYNAIPWLDMIWERYLTDKTGNARVKVHGFGITAATLMVRYPWYSIDSASWRLSAINGQIFHPDFGTIDIGAKRSSRKEMDKHWSTLEPSYQNEVRKRIESLGFTIERLEANNELSRSIFNINSYAEINRRIRKAPPQFRSIQPGIFQ